MAYSNVTPPTLPEYDSETYGFYVLVFNYELGAEDWYMCHLIYGAWRFQYEEGLGVTNTGTTFTRTYSEGSWAEETQNTETLALNPGASGVVYQRIYTNANIFNGDEIWLAENSVTPVEGQKFPIKDFINSMIMALCSRAVQWPKREPTLFLYGTPSESGNIGLRAGDTVTLYNGWVTPPLPEWDKEKYPYAVINYYSDGGIAEFSFVLYASSAILTAVPNKYGGTNAVAEEGASRITVAEYDKDNNEWKILGYEYSSSLSIWNPDWSNCDIVYEDGTTYLKAADPIPVSGIVDYIDDVPIYE